MAVARGALRGRVAGCAVLLVLGGVAGCTSDAEPSPLPSPTSSPSPSQSSTAAAPSLPPEAEGTSPAAAKAFVRHWIDTLNYAGASGEVEHLRALSHNRCVSCTAVIEAISKVYSAGGHYEGAGWAVEAIKYQPLQPRLEPVLVVGVDIAPQTVLEREGRQPERFEGGNRSMTFRLARVGSQWVVKQLDQPA